jgi:hypothetical protein
MKNLKKHFSTWIRIGHDLEKSFSSHAFPHIRMKEDCCANYDIVCRIYMKFQSDECLLLVS